MDRTEFNAMVNEMVSERWPVQEAADICRRLTREINKTGGGKQRGDGVKLLRRVENRLRQRFYLGEYGSHQERMNAV